MDVGNREKEDTAMLEGEEDILFAVGDGGGDDDGWLAGYL